MADEKDWNKPWAESVKPADVPAETPPVHYVMAAETGIIAAETDDEAEVLRHYQPLLSPVAQGLADEIERVRTDYLSTVTEPARAHAAARDVDAARPILGAGVEADMAAMTETLKAYRSTGA